MNRIVRLVPPRSFPSERLATAARDCLVREMAEHLVAAVHGGLDTSCDQDVIAYLYNAPQRYHHRLILDHMDDALYLAKQDLIAAEMSRG
jgi:hypothetical protein